jgi:2,3-bisphosphoglycerate-independent phosphoglycerate mutase
VNTFAREAARVLAGRTPANMVLLRGFAERPSWPLVSDVYGLRAAAVAGYPMYRGVARLVGMDALEAPEDLPGALDVVAERWRDFDFFYVHVKPIDSAGEDGDFERKAALISSVDERVPRLMALGPDVVVVTGDHSTPATLRRHSAHPVPVVLWSKGGRPDEVRAFGERACMAGALGANRPAKELMALALAEAGRLDKFGA